MFNGANQYQVFITCVNGWVAGLKIADISERCVKQGRVFYDEESAQKFSRYEQLTQEMRVVAAKYELCDWRDTCREKYTIGYSYHNSKWCEYAVASYIVVGSVYCAKSGALLEWVNSLSASDQEILKRGEL